MSWPVGLPTPTPSTTTGTRPAREPDPDSVTPGVEGFLAIFAVALATWLLLRNMTGRLRRLRLREQGQSEQQRQPGESEPSEDQPGG